MSDTEFTITCPYCGEEVEIYLEPDTRGAVITRLVRTAMGQGVRHTTQQTIGNLTDAA